MPRSSFLAELFGGAVTLFLGALGFLWRRYRAFLQRHDEDVSDIQDEMNRLDERIDEIDRRLRVIEQELFGADRDDSPSGFLNDARRRLRAMREDLDELREEVRRRD